MLRGLCAVGVMLYHYTYWFYLELPPLLDAFLEKVSIYGVEAFFVISGFSLFHVYAPEHRLPRDAARVKQYFMSRFVRLAPLFALATVVEIAFLLQAPTPASTASLEPFRIAANLLMFFGFYDASASLVTGGWSLGVEVVLYVVFPAAAYAVLKSRAMFAGLVALSLAGMVAWQAIHGAAWRDYVNPVNHVFFFFAGMSLSAIHSRRPALRRGLVVASGLASFALFVLLVPVVGHWQEIATGGNRLLFSLLTVALVGVVAFLDIPAGRVSRGLVYLGAISYSVYLIHPLVVTAGQIYVGFPSPVAGMFGCIVVTLLMASAVYRWYERPLMRLYQRRASGRNPAGGAFEHRSFN